MQQFRRGFSLLEMSIVLLIVGVVMGGGMFMLAESVNQKQFNITKEKLAVLQQTLLDYRRAFNRLPCPADSTAGIDAAAFGREVTFAPGICIDPGIPVDAIYSVGNLFSGMIPTKTLGLPDDYAFDGWGRRMTYAVHLRYAALNAFTTWPITDATSYIGIYNQAGNFKTPQAIYVIVSHGKNGHGAFPRGGGSVRVSAKGQGFTGSTNTDELINCHCDATGAHTGLTTAFVQQPINSENTAQLQRSFDDLVVYATRVELRTLTE